MQLFYNPHITTTTKEFVFDKIESRHIVKVLRKKNGDSLYFTNGHGTLFHAKIATANIAKCAVVIVANHNKPKPWNYWLHIAIAPTKNIDRLEWFLEKATEIGIDEITPIICQRSERKIIKTERLQKIIEAAMKQSLKFQLPKLNPLTNFENFIAQEFNSDLFIAHCEPSEKKQLKSLLIPKRNTTVLIGPEGDFSISEIHDAKGQQFIPVSLGESRLRTETAGMVVTQLLSFINE